MEEWINKWKKGRIKEYKWMIEWINEEKNE